MLELLSALLRIQPEPTLEAALSLLRTPSDVERSERFRVVVNAVAGFGAPVLIVLDDLHAADLDSLELCLQLAPALRASRVLLVATQRSVDSGAGAETQQLLEQLARVSPALELRGLDVSGVSELIVGLSGRAPDPAFAEALQRATLGNCLFVDAVVRAALSDGSFDRGTIRVPSDLRRVIAARVERVGCEVADVLRAVAALGRPCSLTLLARATGRAESALQLLLDAAIDAALAIATEEGTIALRHTLVGDALVASLAPAERARLYAGLAQALEQVEGARASAAEVARLLHAALPLLGAKPAQEASVRAAEWASELCAHEQAVRHRRDVLALIDGYGAADAPARLEAVLALGEACLTAGRREQARAQLLEAARLAQQVSDGPALGRAALALAETGEFGKQDLQRIQSLEQAARLLEPLFNDHRFDEVLAAAAPDIVVEMLALGQIHRGHAGFREFMLGFKRAFPDLRIEIRSQTADAQRVSAEIVAVGTQSGPLQTPQGPLPATGRRVTFTACEVWDIREGRIVAIRNYQDIGSVLRQMGAA
jgi:steroid delta-isomerase-like uncharacterized protein